MREIKFRAWSKVFKAMAPDHAEFHFDGDNSHLHFDVFNGNFDTDVWDFSECEIMQYTGLKDKNGVEIYEGDILSLDWLYQESEEPYTSDSIGIKYVIKWLQGKFIAFSGCTFDLSEINQSTFERFWRQEYNSAKPEYFKMTNILVVGNIYENPELLEDNND